MKAYDIKKGTVVEHNNGVYQVRDIERSSPQGRGGNVRYRFVMYSVPGGNKLDVSFDGDDDLKEVEMTRRQAGFSYKDGDAFVFMDDEDYSQYLFKREEIADELLFITEEIKGLQVLMINGEAAALELPPTVDLVIDECAPAMKAASATSRTKPASFATGLVVQVPEYITAGEKIRINTAEKRYMSRAD